MHAIILVPPNATQSTIPTSSQTRLLSPVNEMQICDRLI